MTLVRLMRPIIHSIIIAIIYWLAYEFRMESHTLFRFIDLGIAQISVQELTIYATISIVVFVSIGIIKKRYDLVWLWLESTKEFFSVRGQRTIIVTCLAYFWQWFLFERWISRLIIITVALVSIIIIPLVEYCWKIFYTKRIKKNSHSLLILYHDSEQSESTIKELNIPSYYHIHKKKFSWPLSEPIQEDIVLLIGAYNQEKLQEIIDHIRLQSKELYHIGDNHFLEDVIYTPKKIWWLRTIRYQITKLEWRASVIKRLCDIVISSMAIILLSPLLLITAIIIKIDNSGPIFYIQDRVGKNGKSFRFIKFRSMYTHLSVGKEYGGEKAREYKKQLMESDSNVRKGELQKIENDPRITRVWRLIRASSIDELPNLFSVLKGDMSLIGPRPHEPFEIARYKPRQRRVLSIKPGVTGYAQIQGRDTLSFDEEASKELEYIQNRSLWLDIYILFATVGVLFGGRGK